jgi:hypothetical protein
MKGDRGRDNHGQAAKLGFGKTRRHIARVMGKDWESRWYVVRWRERLKHRQPWTRKVNKATGQTMVYTPDRIIYLERLSS